MTSYELYSLVAKDLKTNWTQTPIYMEGEVIKVRPPYLVVRFFGVGTLTALGCSMPQNTQTCMVMCFGDNRGETYKLISDVQLWLYGRKVRKNNGFSGSKPLTIDTTAITIDSTKITIDATLIGGASIGQTIVFRTPKIDMPITRLEDTLYQGFVTFNTEG